MTFIFDHLISILVGATLLGALLFVQQRGQQASIETNIRHRTETQTSSFLNTLTRDIENARTSKQVTTGLGTWVPDSKGTWNSYAFGVYGSRTRTEWVQFVTLADPESGSASDLQGVGYRAVELADSVEVQGAKQPLYRVDRYVYEHGATDWVQRGGSAPNLLRFSINALSAEGDSVYNWRIRDLPPSVSVRLEAAESGVGQKTSDQQATTRTNATAQSMSIRIPNANSSATATATAPPGGPGVIPVFPGVDPTVPTSTPGSPGSPGTPGDTDPEDSDPGTPGGSTPTGPTAPDTTGIRA